MYLYIPTQLEEEIQENRTQWVDEAVQSFLKILLCLEFNKLSPRMSERYTSVLQSWDYGRQINPDCVVIRRPNKKDIRYHITTVNTCGLQMCVLWS